MPYVDHVINFTSALVKLFLCYLVVLLGVWMSASKNESTVITAALYSLAL